MPDFLEDDTPESLQATLDTFTLTPETTESDWREVWRAIGELWKLDRKTEALLGADKLVWQWRALARTEFVPEGRWEACYQMVPVVMALWLSEHTKEWYELQQASILAGKCPWVSDREGALAGLAIYLQELPPERTCSRCGAKHWHRNGEMCGRCRRGTKVCKGCGQTFTNNGAYCQDCHAKRTAG